MGKRSGPLGHKAWIACALGVAWASAGCSSSYKPAQSPRASLVLDEGSPHVVRDGSDQGGFTFGGGVVDAVQSNPRAAQEARIGRNLVIGGFVIEIGGLALETGGLVYALENPEQNARTGLDLAFAGVALALGGTIMILNGQPHLYDALNIYNDGVEENRPPALPQPALQPPQPAQLPPPPPAPTPKSP